MSQNDSGGGPLGMSSPVSSPVRGIASSSPPPRGLASPFSTSSRGVPSSRGNGHRDYGSSPLNVFSPGSVLNTPGSRGGGRNDLGVPGRRIRRTPRTPGGDPVSDSQAGKTDPTTDGLGATEVEGTYVWGTNVNIIETTNRFRRFINGYIDGDSDEPLYPALIEEVIKDGETSINLDCKNLDAFDPELYQGLVAYPQEIIPIFDLVINDMKGSFVDANSQAEIPPLQVRTFNMKETRPMRELNPSDIDTMVSVRGMVTRTSPIIPDLKQAFFKCTVCQHPSQPVYINRGRINEPERCPRPECNALHSMALIHNRCSFTDKQQVRMQETPDAIPEGETPHTVTVCVFDDVVDVAKPGDRVEITGVYRAVPVRVSRGQRNVMSIFKTYIDCIHIRRDDPNRLQREETDAGLPSKDQPAAQPTPSRGDGAQQAQQGAAGQQQGGGYQEGDTLKEDSERHVEKLKALARDPAIYEKLVASLAPSIWELEDVKKGVLCQLFGGTHKEVEQRHGHMRGEINCLLVGDPGVSKSQLLSYVHKLAPRGIYTSGRGSSAVGLTAYVTKDPETKEMMLESGALVLSDRGICCIDEFDKMSESARSMLHEVMEQQTVSVAKAGIICSLNARTSVLASANPIGSRYNPRMSVIDNIQLPPTLLSRFDLIYLLLDKPDQARDRKLARHLVAMHFPEAEQPKKAEGVLGIQTLASYISYARQHVHPVLTDEAADDLISGYVEMRRMGGGKKVITATPRQLESIIRLSEAQARMRLNDTVSRENVREALRLVKVAMQQSATDPRTGLVDMDTINTGVSASDREHRAMLASELRAMLQGEGGGLVQISSLQDRVKGQSGVEVTRTEIRDALQLLHQEQMVVLDPFTDAVRVRV